MGKRHGPPGRFEDGHSETRKIARRLLNVAEGLRREQLEQRRKDIAGGTLARGHTLADGTPVPPSQRARVALFEERPHRDDRAQRFDREERNAGRHLRAAFWSTLGEPPLCNPGDKQAARAYVKQIEATLERGLWTRNEVTMLRQLYRKWDKRAKGEDARFNMVGNRRGRLPRPIEQKVRHGK